MNFTNYKAIFVVKILIQKMNIDERRILLQYIPDFVFFAIINNVLKYLHLRDFLI